MILVTGAAGHIGNVLVRYLVSKNHKVRAMTMQGEDSTSLLDTGAEIVAADVTDSSSLDRIFKGVDYVYHLAGIISITSGQKKLLEKVNVEGTKNIIVACHKHKVKRLVYFSSIHAFEEPMPSGELNENQSFNPETVVGDYGRSKAQASLAVMDAVKNGLDAVIVAPVGVIGPYDFRLSEIGQVFTGLYLRRLPALIDGAYDFVDVRDIAIGAELARERGRKGQSYILGGERISIRQAAEILAATINTSVPRWTAPMWLAKTAAPFISAYSFVTGQKPIFSSYAIYTLSIKYKISDDKARRELGYAPRPIRESIVDAVEWLKENKWQN